MNKKNIYGLPRHIPNATKLEVRKICSYGCVICGSVPYQYDHLRVPFAEARIHDPEDIVLLCPSHHTMKTNGLISIETVETAKKQRKNKDSEFRFRLPATSPNFEIIWPSLNLNAVNNCIIIDNEPVFRIDYQEDELEPIVLSGHFTDLHGNNIFQISSNEIIAQSSNIGDFNQSKDSFEFKTPTGKISISFKLSSAGLSIQKIFHSKRDAYVFGDENILQVGNLFSGARLTGASLLYVDTAFDIASCMDTNLSFEKIEIKNMPITYDLRNATIMHSAVGFKLEAPPKQKFTSNYGKEFHTYTAYKHNLPS